MPVDPVISPTCSALRSAKFFDESLAALIAKRGQTTRIFLEQSDPPYRKRFSIAHGLGHHFLHLHEDGEIVDKRADMFREKEPDGLMPKTV